MGSGRGEQAQAGGPTPAAAPEAAKPAAAAATAGAGEKEWMSKSHECFIRIVAPDFLPCKHVGQSIHSGNLG